MKWLLRIFIIASLPLLLLSCSQDASYTVTAAYDSRILVAQDKETMERLIECAVTHECEPWSVMELLPSRKAFFIKSGTKVVVKGGLFAFSDATKVHILEGEHGGEDAWAYNRMLYQDKSNLPYQLAFASICPRSAK